MLQNHPRLFHYAFHLQSTNLYLSHLWTNFNCGMWNRNVGRNCRVTSTGEWHTQLDEEGKQWPPWSGILEGESPHGWPQRPHIYECKMVLKRLKQTVISPPCRNARQLFLENRTKKKNKTKRIIMPTAKGWVIQAQSMI